MRLLRGKHSHGDSHSSPEGQKVIPRQGAVRHMCYVVCDKEQLTLHGMRQLKMSHTQK